MSCYYRVTDLSGLVVNLDTSVAELKRQINANGVQGVCVLDDVEGNVVGIITDSDLRKSTEPSNNHCAADIMNTNFTATRSYNPFYEYGFPFVPLIDSSGGLLSVLFKPTAKLSTRANDKALQIVGAGYVGLTLAIKFAAHGASVTVYETDNEKISLLRSGICPIFEEGLQETFDRFRARIDVRPLSELTSVDNLIVTIGTPWDEYRSEPLTEPILRLVETVRPFLTEHSRIYMRSTVPVGFCEEVEELLVKLCQHRVPVISAPERTVEGLALKELGSNPQFIAHTNCNFVHEGVHLFERICSNIVELPHQRFGEVLKLVDNTYRDYRFAFGNMISIIAQRLGVSGFDLVSLSNFRYPRNDIPKPSLGVGGPCLSKDPNIFHWSLRNTLNLDFPQLQAGRIVSKLVVRQIVDLVMGLATNTKCVQVLGVSFKGTPLTKDVRDSTAILFVKQLLEMGIEVGVWDPLFTDDEIETLGFRPIGFSDLGNDCDVLVIANDSELLLRELTPARHLYVIDCGGRGEKHFSHSTITYIKL